jgi:hypothetical protein
VIGSVERDKSCAWNLGGQNSPFFRGYNSIAIAVEDEGRHRDQGQERPDVDLNCGGCLCGLSDQSPSTEHSARDRMLGILRDNPSGDGLPTILRVLGAFSERKSLTISKRLGRREWRSIAATFAGLVKAVCGKPACTV